MIRSRLAAALLGTIALLISPWANAEAESAQRHLLAADTLYQSLEYERALEEVKLAKSLAPMGEDAIAIQLFEGLLLAELGRRDEARAAFISALFQRPDAMLPRTVSPKVQSDFDAVKQEVRAKLAKGVRITDRKLSLGISTLPQLVLRSLEATAEWRVADKFGIAALLGFGIGSRIAGTTVPSGFEIGGQVRMYPVGTFDHGMPIGMQIDYVNAGGGGMLQVGPFIGYKLVLGNGFTLDTRAGFVWAPVRSAALNEVSFFPLFNVNVGWSLFGTAVTE